MNLYRKLVVYYFSGTGNSSNVAFTMARQAQARGMEVQLVNLVSTDRLHPDTPAPDALLVFVSPVHGFNYPPAMLHFIWRFPVCRNHVLLMNTRAGMLIGKFVPPGISGISLYLSALLLWLKGCRIRALYPVDLPSNWISLHPGLNNRTVEFIYNKTLPKIREFAEESFVGKQNLWSVREIVVDAVVAPVAVLYYLVGRFVIAKTFYASRDCNLCDACVKNCPVKAIKKVDSRLFWTFRCESCMRCMCNCPQRAIETAHGTLLCLSILFASILNALVYKSFNLMFVENSSLLNFVF